MKQMQANSKRWLSVLMAIIMVCMNIGPMQAVFAEEHLDDLSPTTNSIVAEVPAQQPTEDTTTPSAPEEAAAQQPTKDTVAQQPSEDVTAQQSTEDATQQPAEEETAQQPTEDAAQQPTEDATAQQPTEDATQQPSEDVTAQQSTEDATQQPTEDATAQQPTEDVAQQLTEDATAQQPTEDVVAQPIIEGEPEIKVLKSVRAMAKASSGVTLNLGFGSTGNDKAYEGTSFTITWNKMDDADHYEVSVRDLTLDKLIYDHETVSKSKNKFTISSKYMIANHSYRVWVGAAVTGVEGFESSHQAQSEFVCYEWECSHQNGTYRDVTKKTYKSISDTQHKYTEYYNLRCNDCDEILESNLTEEGTDDHFLDSNGDCKLCDYTFSCDHSKTKIVIDNTGYAQKSETHHLYFETGHVVCKNALCQKVLEPYYDEEEEEHTFEDGVCSKCGYIKAEELSIVVARGMANATAGENISASVTIKGGSGKYSIAWEVLYNGSAKYTTDYTMPSTYSYTTDKAGNWQFKVYVKDTKDNTELTATTDSIVVAEAVCDHAETHEELIETEYSIASDTNHEIKDYYKVVCSKCGDVINERFYKTRLEPHTLDDNGKCICGYTAPTEDCNHSGSVEKPIDSYTEQYNEKWHYVVTVYQDECANCGVVLNERREVKNFEAHSYDAKGICTACGYAQPTEECDHAPTKTELSTSYEIVDAEYHRVTINYHYECACGQVNYDEPTTKNEQHKFINGVCNLCGYEQQKVININGAFAKDSYMMKAGGTLEVGLTASATNANLTRVTVNVDGSENDRLASKEISGTSWNGNLTLDGTVAPLNTPGTYTIKLYVAVDAGDPNYAQVDTATLVVEEAEEIPTISITSPSSNDQVSFEKNLSVVWTEVEKADHYEFSARYEDETDAFIVREKTTEKGYTIPAASLKSGKKLILWVGACDASRNVLNGTVQATVTVTVAENTTTISITSPSNNAEISFGKDLIVEWSAAKEADHYEFSARYDDETTPIINRAPVKEEKYTIDAGQLKLGKKLNLWVGACDANGQVINGTVQASATVTIAAMGSPNVTIDLDELDMTAMWPAVDGAVRYVYSLKNKTDNVSIADHADAANRTITQKLQAGKEYRLAVGAVPAGVDDVANAGSCSWAEKTFNTMPAVVDFTVEPNPVMLGKEAIFKVYNQRAEKVKLIVDGVEYEEYDASSDPQIIKRAFSQSGSRSIQFKAFGGGVWGEPCAAVKLEVLPAGKVPDPVISNISAKEIILSDSRTIYWRIDGDEEDLGIDYYSVTLARMENGTWAPVYVVNTTDDQEASGGGIALNGLLSIPGNYRLMVIAVPYGEGMDSELTGRTSVEFGYRTVPEFSLSEIVNDETIGVPVTVKWNRPTWSNDPKLQPDKYIVWWYGPGMESGMAVEVSGDSSEAVLGSDYCKQPGGYAVGVYALLGDQQSLASGNGEFAKANPEVTIETTKGPYLTTDQFYAIGSTKGGIKFVRVQLEKDGGAELVPLVGADGNSCDYVVVGVDPDTKKYMAFLPPVNELIENGTYAIAVYGFFSDADANNTDLRADSDYIMLTINGSKVDRVDLIGSRTSEKVSATWRYTNDSMQVKVHGNNAMKNMVVSWNGGSASQQKTEADGEWNQWLYSNPFSFSSSGKRSLTVDVDGKKRYVTVYIVKPQSGTRYAAKDSVAVLWLPGGNTRKTIGLNDVATVKGEYGDYWLVNAGGVTGFVLKGDVSSNMTVIDQSTIPADNIGGESKPIELPPEKEIKDWIKRDEVGDDGYLLLEMMLDENNDGQLFKVARGAWNFNLELLQLDFFSMGKHVVEHFNYDNKIEEILLDSYVQYMNEKAVEIAAIETDDKFRETISALAKNKKYTSLIQKIFKEMGLPETLDVTKLSDIDKYIYGMKMDDTQRFSLLLQKYGYDLYSSEADFKNMMKEYEDWNECLPQLRTIEKALTETAYSVIDIYKFAADYKKSYNKHENLVSYMCYVNADFLNMLDQLEEEVKHKPRTEYYQYYLAISKFRQAFDDVAQDNIDKVVRRYATSDTGNVVQTKITKLGYDIALDALKKYGLKMPKTGWVGLGASLVSSGAEMTDYLSPDKKNEILDNMIYIRTLKSLMADTLNTQLDSYDGVSQDSASEIQASLGLMKALMIRGENESLKLLKMITTSAQIYQPWRMVIEKDGVKYYSTNSVDPTSENIDDVKRELEANGAKVGFVRIAEGFYVPQGAGDSNIMKEYSDFVKNGTSKVIGKDNDAVSFMSGGIVEEGDIVDVESAKKLSEGDIEYAKQQLEDSKDDPKYYQYWEDFVDTYSRRRIDKLGF